MSTNKRIAKNTLLLYIRMLVTMLVSLYTARVVLNVLGVVDYGVYSVVGGIVTMCSFISSTMASTSMRFFSYELGYGNMSRLKETFAATVNIYFLLSILILLFAETIGLWFVSTQLNIPPDRMSAALYVYQFSVLGFLATILRIPYNAVVISREKMSFYAWLSILEALLKLGMVFLLVYICWDKLILYAVLMSAVLCLITVSYFLYCRLNFEECRFSWVWEKSLYRSLLGFAGWNLFGSLANVGLDQGLNILLNIFFGAPINAARSIAFQIRNAVQSFVGSFQTAASPQIVKYYAAGEKDSMKKLLFQSSKYSFFLLLLIALPILLEMEMVLSLWLIEIPPYTLIFARLIIILSLVDCLSGTIIPAVQSTGFIRFYQITVCSIILLNVPVSYFFLKMGFPPQSTVVISIFLSCTALVMRVYVLRKLLAFPMTEYFSKVVWNDLKVFFLALLLPFIVHLYLPKGMLSFCVSILFCVISTLLAICYAGLNSNERRFVYNQLENKILKRIWKKTA